MNIGLVPFTRQSPKHPKVGHMIGKGVASGEMTTKLNKLKCNYSSLKEEVAKEGIDHFVFILSIPV